MWSPTMMRAPATARLTIEAVSRISHRWVAPPIMEYYRAYANRYWPMNLSPRIYQEKAGYLSTYAGADGEYGQGDHQLGTDPYRSTHMFSQAQRYVATTTWLTRLAGGELAAFAVLGDRLAMWRESKPGSDKWSGPVLIGEPGVMPTLAVAASPQGPVHVAALRRVAEGRRVEVEVGYLTVDAAGTASPWVSLGNPDAEDPDRRRQREIGVPAATVDGRGDLWVFVRDFTGGLSCRRQSSGEWHQWETLGRGPLQDVPVATTTQDGLVRVFVAAKLTVAHWRQEVAGGPLEPHHNLKRAGWRAAGCTWCVPPGIGPACCTGRAAQHAIGTARTRRAQSGRTGSTLWAARGPAVERTSVARTARPDRGTRPPRCRSGRPGDGAAQSVLDGERGGSAGQGRTIAVAPAAWHDQRRPGPRRGRRRAGCTRRPGDGRPPARQPSGDGYADERAFGAWVTV